jgi:hypothetical protein
MKPGVSLERRQSKAVGFLVKVLPPGAAVRAYGAGWANARMTLAAASIIIGFATLYALVAVLAGRLLIPGIPVLILFVGAVKPMRGLAVMDDRIAVVSVSAWNAHPKSVLYEVPLTVMAPPLVHLTRKGVATVALGPDVVRLRSRDYQRLSAGFGTADSSAAYVGGPTPRTMDGHEGSGSIETPSAVTAPAGWYPVAGDEYRRAYWTGTSWTDSVRWDGREWVTASGSLP